MSIAKTRKLWVDGYNLSGHLQGLAFEASVEMQDDTVFGDTARSNEPGLDDFSIEHEGVWSAGVGLPDTVFEAERGLADVLASIAPVAGTEGGLAYFMRTTQGLYKPGGTVGSLLWFSVSLRASGGIGAIRGSLMVNANLAATADGTAYQLGAVSGSQKLYAGLHVLSVTGSSPTLDVIVESDDQEGFAGSPSTRITFAQATGITSEWATPVAGAITDDWWRIGWTIGGTSSPAFDAVVVVGIQ